MTYEYTWADFDGGTAEASTLGWTPGMEPPVTIGIGGRSFDRFIVVRANDEPEGEVLGWEYFDGMVIVTVWND